ncbi:hypothetical protein TNCV_3504711 [Trichonephila clavipes]|uniref:Uncharacterized protein n=1 Tax=Trichonephila clavipes TaxID=2585209 RepID=A0A8X6RXP0_TRICX|nr:hypothetical protein TNCV_3504711 [Trichonephila clavipes]
MSKEISQVVVVHFLQHLKFLTRCETKTRSLTTPDKFNALSTETLPESVPTTSNSEPSNAPEIPQCVKRNSRNRRKRPKVQKSK